MADHQLKASSAQEQETRKGPWTEQEDFQLVCFVGLFGDRRWDFIAKVSGLNRTGKSCRLRWVNYLHPGLKRGKMTPLEERLVLELHAKWGNRWSRIARKLPGRTDNEIKNYWRTHMRKKAQEKKRANGGGGNGANAPPSPSPSSSSDNSNSNSNSKRSSSSSSSNITTVDSLPFHDSTTGVESFYDTGGRTDKKPVPAKDAKANFYSMDDIWKAISLPEVNTLANMVVDHPLFGSTETVLQGSSEIIESDAGLAAVGQFDQFYCSDSLWKIDDEASNAFFGGFGCGETLTSGS